RARKPTEAERDRSQAVDSSVAPGPEARYTITRRDQQRAGAAVEAGPARQVAEDGQQRAERSQHAVEAGGGMGRAGDDALLDSPDAGDADGRRVPRLRGVRAVAGRGADDRPAQ